MSEPQLERSVLEGKQKEELRTIAKAVGEDLPASARKSDLVDAILRAAGVDVSPAPEAPRRSRTRKTTARTAAAPALAGEPASSPAEGSEAGVSAEAGQLPFEPATPELSGEDAGGAGAASSDAAPSVPEVGSPQPSGSPLSGAAAPVSQPATSPVSQPAAPETSPASRTQAPGSPALRSAPSGSQPAGSQPAGSQPAGGAGRLGSQSRSRFGRGGFVASPDGGTSGAAPTSAGAGRPPRRAPEPQRGGADSERRGNGQADTRPAAPEAPAVPAPQPAAAVPAERPGNTNAEAGEPRPRVEGEAGNRRNRRRRGRDRGERNAERDLVSQNNDAPYAGEPLPVSGYLDLRDEGYGFLRTQGYLASGSDVYVSISQVRRFHLRKGDWLEGAARPAGATEKYPALLRIDSVGGQSPDEARSRPAFDELTAVTPTEALPLQRDDDPSGLGSRVVDLFAPLGRGQRALIAGPPRSGKTGVLVDVINSLAAYPDLQLFVVVIDERPEEVTELRRAVPTEVAATTFDQSPEDHVQVAELVVERAKRLVEAGAEVVVLFDGLTRLARAYNQVPSGSSRVLPGGIDPGSLQRPLGVFGAGRNIESGGSLTLLATALVETGSRLDDMLYEELSAAANATLLLDRELAKRGVRPAIDFDGSWCRNEDRLVGGGTLEQLRTLRLLISAPGSGLGAEELIERLGATKSNQEFLADVAPALTRSDGHRKRGAKA